jgi:hypothetical protein
MLQICELGFIIYSRQQICTICDKVFNRYKYVQHLDSFLHLIFWYFKYLQFALNL